MKIIEIKEDGVVIGTKYLHKVTFPVSKNILNIDDEYYLLLDEPPFLYKDHNGNEVMNGQNIFWVQIKAWPHGIHELWKVFDDTATGDTNELDKDHLAIFTTKEAADKFVSENSPHMLISEDGVKMYDRSGVWCVPKDRFIKTLGLVSSYMIDSFFYFSTEQAANDYIKKKKLSLSLGMIEKGLTSEGYDWSDPTVQQIFRTLTNLVNEQFKPQ